ncbi:hypothetical protein J4G08_17245, partial [Candidatus Poribacteria bacterium]|nr:hypothetical protein [Candidatus Poribacteria bacterium]
FPVWHAAKSTLNARVGIHPNQRSMRVRHAAGLKTPPTRRYILKLTVMGRVQRNPTCILRFIQP